MAEDGKAVLTRGHMTKTFHTQEVLFEPQTVTQYWHLEAIVGPTVHR